VQTFQFPIRKADGKQFSDAEHLHRLLGKSGYWHGGIHIGDKSAPHLVLSGWR
jgi:hypothetical protein